MGSGAVRWMSCWSGGAASGARALKGSGEVGFTPEAEGVGRGGVYARGQGGRARRNLRPRPWGVGWVVVWTWGPGVRWAGARSLVIVVNLLCHLRFLLLWFGYPFLWYPTVDPEPLKGWGHLFRGSFLRDYCWPGTFLLFSGGCARAHPPGVAPEPFGGMVLFLQRLLPLSAIVWSILRDRLRVLLHVVPVPMVRESSRALSPQGSIRFYLVLWLRPSFFLSLRGGVGRAVLPSMGE